MASHRALFVAGAGTEIGKTYATAALTRRLLADGRRVRTLKPLASGVPPIDDRAFSESDTARLLAAQGLPVTPAAVAACSPWRFLAPLAPDLAAAQEGRSLSLDALVAWCAAQIEGDSTGTSSSSPPQPHPEVQGEASPRRRAPGSAMASGALLRGPLARAPRDEVVGWNEVEAGSAAHDPLVLIEGVGGLMSPVTAGATGLDWVKALRLPVLLVSGSYLGAVSHALTAVETLRAHAVPLVAVVVSESEGAPTPPDYVVGSIIRHGRVPAAILTRDGGWPDALAELI